MSKGAYYNYDSRKLPANDSMTTCWETSSTSPYNAARGSVLYERPQSNILFAQKPRVSYADTTPNPNIPNAEFVNQAHVDGGERLSNVNSSTVQNLPTANYKSIYNRFPDSADQRTQYYSGK